MTLPHPIRSRSRRVALGVATLAASGLIAACGSSSSTSSTTTSSASSGTTSATRTALVKCLQQHGVKPPPGFANGSRTRPSGSGAPAAGGGGIASNPTLQAAFKACGATGHRPTTG